MIGSFSFLQVTRTTIKAWMSLNFHKFECLKKLNYILVSTLAPSFLIGSSSFLQVPRTII